MNDNLMFDYLLEMGAMRPEQDEMRRKQAMVDALRGRAMEPMQGQMVGKHYVAPGIANAIAQMGTAYMAGQQQKGVDASMVGMNERQGSALRRMQEMQRRKRLGLTNITGEMDTADYGGGM
jgi:calcineurin-like phosphoesterase